MPGTGISRGRRGRRRSRPGLSSRAQPKRATGLLSGSSPCILRLPVSRRFWRFSDPQSAETGMVAHRIERWGRALSRIPPSRQSTTETGAAGFRDYHGCEEGSFARIGASQNTEWAAISIGFGISVQPSGSSTLPWPCATEACVRDWPTPPLPPSSWRPGCFSAA
jgi:hypothetical protein